MLSTPPAFILSQDQTLMFEFNLSQVKLGFSFIQINLNLLFKGLRLNRSVRQSFDCLNYSLWIFQGFSLFSYQCSSLSELYIHQRQLLYLSKFFRVCQELFFNLTFKFERRRRDLNPRASFPAYSLSRGAPSASWVLLHLSSFRFLAERVGFEPSRRFPDLYP